MCKKSRYEKRIGEDERRVRINVTSKPIRQRDYFRDFETDFIVKDNTTLTISPARRRVHYSRPGARMMIYIGIARHERIQMLAGRRWASRRHGSLRTSRKYSRSVRTKTNEADVWDPLEITRPRCCLHSDASLPQMRRQFSRPRINEAELRELAHIARRQDKRRDESAPGIGVLGCGKSCMSKRAWKFVNKEATPGARPVVPGIVSKSSKTLRVVLRARFVSV